MSGSQNAVTMPSDIEFVETLPKTRSGKIMRRVLKAKEMGIDPGDISTLEECPLPNFLYRFLWYL